MLQVREIIVKPTCARCYHEINTPALAEFDYHYNGLVHRNGCDERPGSLCQEPDCKARPHHTVYQSHDFSG
jgi:hypothetical protein